ncbi:hypothetical protein [Rheinheimera sp. WS51]|uniref:hypothetical protein n=1 Tax=Rheinheimera sp. WS51 TaxID=3425886 RepID=UPI003D8E535B
MILEHFIDSKAQQLIKYASAYFSGQLLYNELHLFIWDTLEEWAQYSVTSCAECDDYERVFWYLIHQLEYWPEAELIHNQPLRLHIQYCLRFLQGSGIAPANCIGIRP